MRPVVSNRRTRADSEDAADAPANATRKFKLPVKTTAAHWHVKERGDCTATVTALSAVAEWQGIGTLLLRVTERRSREAPVHWHRDTPSHATVTPDLTRTPDGALA